MYGDYETTQRVLRNPFNISTHKETFKNYLEVIIDNEGIVHYAVPSHQEYLIQHLIATTYHSRDALNDAVPREYWFDMLTWLTDQSGMVCVWNDRYAGRLNEAQKQTLMVLQDNDLYFGEIKDVDVG